MAKKTIKIAYDILRGVNNRVWGRGVEEAEKSG